MQNKKKNMGVVILSIILILTAFFLIFQLFLKEKVCPDKFYDNQTPRVCLDGNDCGDKETRYYVKDSKGIEFSKYNQYYVMFICGVQPSVLF